MSEGFLKLWRTSLDSQVWQNADLWQVWCWCLMRASYKEQWVPIKTGRGVTEVCVGPGQFIFGRKAAAKQLKMKPSSVRERMMKLARMKNLVMQPNTHYSLVTITNWGRYQSDTDVNRQATRQPTDRQPTGNRQPTDTYKKVKKVKKEKKEETAVVFPEALDTESFKAKWKEWTSYRREAKIKKLQPRSVDKQLARLTTVGLAEAMACIDKSIASGWQGLFPKDAPETEHSGQDDRGIPFRNPTPEDIAVAYDIPLENVVRVDGDG